MARLMSVAFTEAAVRNRSKTVTRRKGWLFLKPGDRLTLCRKVMGRKAGEAGEDRTAPEWSANSDLDEAWLEGYGQGMAARVQRGEASNKQSDSLPDEAELELASRHRKIDKTLDMMDDAQIAAVVNYIRHDLGNNFEGDTTAEDVAAAR